MDNYNKALSEIKDRENKALEEINATSSSFRMNRDEAEKKAMTMLNGGVVPSKYCGHLNPGRFSVCKAPSCLNPKCVEPKF
ncbi:MAG: hypothetical protein FWC00_05945 [Firmicutes bacterium]|nr:hypothetical protein [Bacillota bacterium]